MVDIARDARWGRIVEGAGEDPYLGAAMARAQVKGFQGEALGPDSVLACVKHFAGYGAAEGGRDYDSSYIPEVLMRNVYLVPFRAAEEAGAGSFMSAYMDLNDVPATGNHWLLSDILRKEWGFKGFVVSDASAVASLQTHGYARDPADAAYKAVSAGLDMDMASQTYTIEGGWTVEGLFGSGAKSHPVTVLSDLKEKLGPNAQVTYVPGPGFSRVFMGLVDQYTGTKQVSPPTAAETADWLAKAKDAAADADVVVAVMGEISGMSGESASRASFDLPGIQEQMLEAVAATGKPVVLVLENGRPLDIHWAAAHVPAILEVWYPGTEGGHAVADVMFGDVNPGGKLPVSWPRSAGRNCCTTTTI